MFRPGKWSGAGFGALTAILMTGCLSDADRGSGTAAAAAPAASSGETWVEAWDASGPPGFPTLEELQAALQLTDEQSAVVGTALEEWRAGMQERRQAMEQRRSSQGHGMPGAFGEFEPPMLAFLEDVIPVLDAGQVSTLATTVQEKRDAVCAPDGGGRGGRGAGEGRGRGGGQGRGGGLGSGQGGPGCRPGGHGPGGPGGPGGPIGGVLRELREELDLSETQREVLHAALRTSHETFRELRRSFGSGDLSAEELRDGAREARLTLESALLEILGEESYALLTETLAEHRVEMITLRLEHLEEGVARRLEFLTNVLELDDSQTSQVAAILADSVTQRRTLLESLRDGTIAIEEALYQGYLIAQATSTAVRDVLTSAQQEIFDALKGLLPGHGGPRHA